MDSFIPVIEKRTLQKGKEAIVNWSGRILNVKGYSIKGDTREEIETRLEEKSRQLNKLKSDEKKDRRK